MITLWSLGPRMAFISLKLFILQLLLHMLLLSVLNLTLSSAHSPPNQVPLTNLITPLQNLQPIKLQLNIPNGAQPWMMNFMLFRGRVLGFWCHHLLPRIWLAVSGSINSNTTVMAPSIGIRPGWWPRGFISNLGFTLRRLLVQSSNLPL